MLSAILIILLSLVFFAYVAVPLIFPSQADPLPDARDPLLQDLEEERDALFRAIRELDARQDLKEERREQLRARYEAKAAKVLRALDARQAELAGAQVSAPRPARRVPYAALGLLAFAVLSATVMSSYVLPRVGENSTVTTFFEEDLEAAEALRDAQRAVSRNPNLDNLLVLADTYWQLDDAENAEATYYRISQEVSPVPAVVYKRLGFLGLQSDLAEALAYLELARDSAPTDPDVLYTLGEVYYAQARPDDAVEAFEAYLAQPEGAGDEQAQARLETIREVAPVLNAATENPSETTLAALAELYWQQEERERASDIYIQLLSNFNPHNEVALSRIGQVLFFGGRNEDAIEVLERARAAGADDLDTLLFLGNAYFSAEQFDEAISVWERYVEVAGGEAQAGRVPSLIETARARQASDGVDASADLNGEQLYVANCASCHGAEGQGGSGPRLAGNGRAANERNVQNIVQYGRGLMPGFGARLSEAELAAVVDYVTTELAASEARSP